MPTLNELRQHASALRKDNKYDQALAVYRQLWEQPATRNEWDGWGYAHCLRKLGRPREALTIARQVYQAYPEFEPNRNEYGWSLYDLVIKQDQAAIAENPAEFFQAADEILTVAGRDQFSPRARTLFKVIDYLEKRAAYPAQQILEWTARATPDELSEAPGRGNNPTTGQPMEFASDREKWYAARTRALLEVGQHAECIALCQEALQRFGKLHHDNDVWFRWRMAQSKAALGDRATAITEIQSLLKRKQDFFLYWRIAQYQFELGQVEEALKNAVAGALAPGELEYKWELFWLMGQILQARGETELAARHVELALALRLEHQWKIPAELSQSASQLNISTSSCQPAAQVKARLLPYWRQVRFGDMKTMTGKITRLLPTGQAGFIRGADGRDYYFRTAAFKGNKRLLTEGQAVSFYVQPSQEAGKADSAVEVTPQPPAT